LRGPTTFVGTDATGSGDHQLQQASHLDKSIASLKSAIAEAIQCGGGGPDGSGCKGPRGEAIKLMNEALKKLYEAGAQK
jgi:hypothetical protein